MTTTTAPATPSAPTVPNESQIYAQVAKSATHRTASKYARFLDTITHLQDHQETIYHPSELKHHQVTLPNIRLCYNVQFRPMEIGSMSPVQFFIDHNKKCFALNSTSEEKCAKKGAKLFAFDAIFTGTISNKLRLLPKTMLVEPLCALVNGCLENVVMLTIDDQASKEDRCKCSPILQSSSREVVEFRELTHRGLMLHAISWLFDAIDNEKTTTPRASLKLSITALYHRYMFDMIPFDRTRPLSVDCFTSVQQHVEYECATAKQAAAYLELALEHYALLDMMFTMVDDGRDCDNLNTHDHLFLFTLHLYKYEILPAGDKQAVESHRKLYIIDMNLPDTTSLNNQLYQMMSMLFEKQTNSFFSKSLMWQSFSEALHVFPKHREICKSGHRMWLSILANMSQQPTDKNVASQIRKHQFLRQLIRSRLLGNCCVNQPDKSTITTKSVKKHAGPTQCKRKQTCRACLHRTNGVKCPTLTKMTEDTDSMHDYSMASSSEQSFDTVIFKGKSVHCTWDAKCLTEHKSLVGGGISSENAYERDRHVSSKCCAEREMRRSKRRSSSRKDPGAYLKRYNKSKLRKVCVSKNEQAETVEKRFRDECCVKRIRKKRVKDGTWTKELWVDGPIAVDDGESKCRIEQWIKKMTVMDDSTFSYCDLLFSNMDQTANRDTMSDCGDKRSDFYDELSTIWQNDDTRRNSGRYPLADECEDSTSEPILFAEPPKQLKLEQFLQQLSKITTFPEGDHCQQFPFGTPTTNIAIAVSSSGAQPNYVAPLMQNVLVVGAGEDTCSSQSAAMATTVQQQRQDMQKMKRNTTSTTTSGHGTISEGECSSIIKKTSSASTPSYGSSNGSNGVVVQRQPASSGYESTIQDDEDFEDDFVTTTTGDDVRHSDAKSTNSTGQQHQQQRVFRQRKIEMWKGKLWNSMQHRRHVVASINGKKGVVTTTAVHKHPSLEQILDTKIIEPCDLLNEDYPSSQSSKQQCSFLCCSIWS